MTPDGILPRSGDVVHVGKDASVQFGGGRDFLFRVIYAQDWSTYDGWIWLNGYQLDRRGDAVERRTIFVQIAGLHQVGKAPDPRTRNTDPRSRNERPAIPRPRPASDTTTTTGRRTR